MPALVTAVEEFAVDVHGGDVDAVGGEKLGVWGEVDGGHGEAAADAASWSGSGVDAEGAAEQGAGGGHVSGLDQFANLAAADFDAAIVTRGKDLHAEAEVVAHLNEVSSVALRLVAEAEVVPFVDLDRMKAVAQYGGDEGLSGHLAEFVGEGKDEHSVDARGAEQLETLVELE